MPRTDGSTTSRTSGARAATATSGHRRPMRDGRARTGVSSMAASSRSTAPRCNISWTRSLLDTRQAAPRIRSPRRRPEQLRHAEDVAEPLDPLQDLGEGHLLEPQRVVRALLDLVPGDGSGHVGAILPAQRVWRDRRLAAGVLRPVEEDLPA